MYHSNIYTNGKDNKDTNLYFEYMTTIGNHNVIIQTTKVATKNGVNISDHSRQQHGTYGSVNI